MSPASADALADGSETEEVLRNDAPSAKQILGALFQFLKRKKFPVIIFAIIIATSFGIYARYFHLTDAERAQKEVKAAMSAVSKHMILPEGDEPVLATVTDAGTLIKQQAFFAGSVNGDQLLLFPRNLKAILYSPSRNKIVNAGPIEQQQQTALEKSPTPTPSVNSGANTPSSVEAVVGRQNTLTVEIRNGTGKNGFGARVADAINALGGYEVLKVADAVSKKYQKTIIVSRTEDVADKARIKALAAAIGAEIREDFPAGEPSTSANILVIAGENKE